MKLETRDDLINSLHSLLTPLEARFVEGDAGLRLGETAAHYAPRVAALEGLSRVFWGLAPLLAGGGSSPLTQRFVRGLVNGTDPEHKAFWGVGGDSDQRQVEMAAFALALLLKPEVFWQPLAARERKNLAAWLLSINDVKLPANNWEFFRILVNVALKTLGQPFSSEKLEAGLVFVESLYRGDGWYIDDTNYDLYNPFALHFYGLVYAHFMGDEDTERSSRFRARAHEFAGQFVPWFASDGTIVPQGRSLGYRFAAVSFFSACAFAGEEVLPWGVMRGLVFRHLRWWFEQPMFDAAGVLTIGYRYPNLLQAEQYNSPGSPYWALKTYLLLALDAGHPFWQAKEAPLPHQPETKELAVPKMLVCRDGQGPHEHVWVLNGGQYPAWEAVNAAAKYAKFAYSNRFGFCVTHGGFDLSKTGCDSSLVLSEGDNYWRERRHNDQRSSTPDTVFSRWKPWPDVTIGSWLVALGPWHVRLHLVESGRALEGAEGGFSLPDYDPANANAPLLPASEKPLGSNGLLVTHPWAWGAIVNLLPSERTAKLHKAEPNLNVLHPKVQIPLLQAQLKPGTTLWACAVAAGLGAPPDLTDLPALERGPGTVRLRWRTKNVVVSVP